jgi:hypothetical protein
MSASITYSLTVQIGQLWNLLMIGAIFGGFGMNVIPIITDQLMKTTPREAHVTLNTVLNMGAHILSSGTVLYFGVLMDWFESVTLQKNMSVFCMEVIVAYYMIAMILAMILEPK